MNKDRLPKVSVVIPLFNQAQYLPEAVESVLDQTYHDFEIIVVDDGSTDESFAAARQYGEKTRYIRQEKTGLGGARNTGIKASQGELIGLLNADDRWLPTYLETMVRLADENPEAAVYYCCAQAMDEHSNDLPQIFGGKSLPVKLMYESLLRANILIPSTVLMRKAIVSAAGLFDQTLRDIDSCEDWDLWLRIAPKHDFVGVPMRLTRYRLYGNTVSSPLTGVQTAVRAVIEKHFGPDDGQWHMWSDEKRRAYGGVYRFYLLNLVKRQNNWRSAAGYFRMALERDPDLAGDLDLFYDLALGSQPAQYRGSPERLDLEKNAAHIEEILAYAFSAYFEPPLTPLKQQTYGTAYHALGLVAYNAGQLSLSRCYLLKGLHSRPDLLKERNVRGNIVKSLFGRSLLERLRKYHRKADEISHPARFAHGKQPQFPRKVVDGLPRDGDAEVA